jgi:hypothetical protein
MLVITATAGHAPHARGCELHGATKGHRTDQFLLVMQPNWLTKSLRHVVTESYIHPTWKRPGSGAHPTSYPMSTGGSCLGRETDHSSAYSAKVKNAWSCIRTPSYAFMAWYLVKHLGTTLSQQTAGSTSRVRPSVRPINKSFSVIFISIFFHGFQARHINCRSYINLLDHTRSTVGITNTWSLFGYLTTLLQLQTSRSFVAFGRRRSSTYRY